MNSFKCPQCNLTNWSTPAECKRCKMAFQTSAAMSPPFQNSEQNITSQPAPSAELSYFQTSGFDSQSNWQPGWQYNQNQNYGSQSFQPPNFRGNPPADLKSGLAITSMVLGILGFTTSILLVGFLVAPIGLALGLTAIVKANKKPHLYGGKGFAITGIILSSMAVLLFPIIAAIAIPNLLAARRAANEASAISSLRTLASAEQTLMAINNSCGDLQKLASKQLIDSVLASGEKTGYRFNIVVSPVADVCEIQATPISGSVGTRSFYISTQEGLIRAANKKGLPADKNDLPLNISGSRSF